MTLDFLPEAAAEFYEAAERYEARQPGLGARFRSELLDVCRSIVQQPLLAEVGCVLGDGGRL